MSNYDTIVIGTGLAGLTTACHLARAGQKTLLVGYGGGALLLASGCIDVLGYQPADSNEPVTRPLDNLDAFLTQNPDHPYHWVGKETIETGLHAFLQLVNQGALEYQGSPAQNWLLPSAAGAVHPTCLAPASFIHGAVDQSTRTLIVGFRELCDFYPALISENLNAQNLPTKTTAVSINLPAPLAGNMNVTPMELAHAFEKPDFRRQVVDTVKGHSKGYSRIGFPAVLGHTQHAEVLADLQQRLDKTVFEINTLPPSVPGRRLFDALGRVLRAAGGRIILGSKVVNGVIEKGRVSHINIETASRLKALKADTFVLATGGLFGGGLQTDAAGRVWETIFNLPITADPNRHHWFTRSFFSSQGQPVTQYGVQVNQTFNPTNGSGTPLAKNLYVAGAALAGAEWTRGRTGNGIAVTTAAAVAKLISSQA
jgi:glycerol-3-phosphate dehydrogenase subunit B